MGTKTKKMSLTRKKLLVDIAVFIVFAIVSAPQSTGIAVHEWLSFIFVVPIITHLLLNWKWIVKITTRMFKKLPGETRFNYIWDFVLFIMMVLVMVSGVLVSESALPAMGIALVIDPFWATLHDLSANLLLLMIGVHLAMHWTWIIDTFKKYILRRTKTALQTAGGQ